MLRPLLGNTACRALRYMQAPKRHSTLHLDPKRLLLDIHSATHVPSRNPSRDRYKPVSQRTLEDGQRKIHKSGRATKNLLCAIHIRQYLTSASPITPRYKVDREVKKCGDMTFSNLVSGQFFNIAIGGKGVTEKMKLSFAGCCMAPKRHDG